VGTPWARGLEPSDQTALREEKIRVVLREFVEGMTGIEPA
jgi:hypothetical protein